MGIFVLFFVINTSGVTRVNMSTNVSVNINVMTMRNIRVGSLSVMVWGGGRNSGIIPYPTSMIIIDRIRMIME